MRFLTEVNTVLTVKAIHEKKNRALWALRRRTHVSCFGLAAFCFSGSNNESEALISTRGKLLCFSIVTTTELGAIWVRIQKKNRETEQFKKRRNSKTQMEIGVENQLEEESAIKREEMGE